VNKALIAERGEHELERFEDNTFYVISPSGSVTLPSLYVSQYSRWYIRIAQIRTDSAGCQESESVLKYAVLDCCITLIPFPSLSRPVLYCILSPSRALATGVYNASGRKCYPLGPDLNKWGPIIRKAVGGAPQLPAELRPTCVYGRPCNT
jgi:hypothetical protein